MRNTSHTVSLKASFVLILMTFVIGFVGALAATPAQAADQVVITKQKDFLRIRKKIDLEVKKQIAADEQAWLRQQALNDQYNREGNPSGQNYPSLRIQPTLPASVAAPHPMEQTLTAPLRQIDQSVVERDGALRIMNRMTCDPGHSICQQICQSTACEWPEPQCRDCFGTGSEVMRDVFVRLSSSYRVIRTISDAGLIEGLMARSMVLVSQKSPYDFFNSSSDPGLSPHLMTMCGSTNGFVAVVLDNDGRPSRAVVAICSNQDGVKAALIERTDDIRSEVLQPIQLKMATDLIAIPKP